MPRQTPLCNTPPKQRSKNRLARLGAHGLGHVQFDPPEIVDTAHRLVGVTSSRLTRDVDLHRDVCRYLSTLMLHLRNTQSRLLISEGSAIAPLATRAAELFQVPAVILQTAKQSRTKRDAKTLQGRSVFVRCRVQSTTEVRLCRDALLIALADQVNAVHVRNGGKVAANLLRRLSLFDDASTRVAILPKYDSATSELIDSGAIGWFITPTRSDIQNATIPFCQLNHSRTSLTSDAWTRSEGQWLSHCTRGTDGRRVGETEHQFQDRLLLAPCTSLACSPLESLCNILRSQTLVANAITSNQKYPVVCFSAAPLVERLQNRSFRSHIGRWDNEPYGIAIRLDAAKRFGILPVIYGVPKERKQISLQDQYRFQAKGTTYDWTQEKEWRSAQSIDLCEFEREEIRVFVPDESSANAVQSVSDLPVTIVS